MILLECPELLHVYAPLDLSGVYVGARRTLAAAVAPGRVVGIDDVFALLRSHAPRLPVADAFRLMPTGSPPRLASRPCAEGTDDAGRWIIMICAITSDGLASVFFSTRAEWGNGCAREKKIVWRVRIALCPRRAAMRRLPTQGCAPTAASGCFTSLRSTSAGYRDSRRSSAYHSQPKSGAQSLVSGTISASTGQAFSRSFVQLGGSDRLTYLSGALSTQ